VIVADSAQREQLGIYYGLAGAFVFPTHSDPWGLVVNEAMACALPVIASRAAGCTADLVGHGENGLVVDPGDVAQLVSAMTEIASSGDRREKMGAAGRERIARYSPVACAEGIAHAAVASRRT
jgi:glycosyltransferase involved in cell wall biosynthesis